MDNKNIMELTADECFEQLKSRKAKITDRELEEIYDNCLSLLNKYKITGQVQGMRKLIFHLENIEKERILVNMGVDTFVYKSDIEDYASHVADKSVKICEIGDYERDIPNEIVSVIAKTKDLFSVMYIVYTDYTGKSERRIEAAKRTQDPILFGSFQNRNEGVVVERFYFLGDWIDEYCDLTLDKMVAEVKKKKGVEIRREISTPKDIEELKSQLENLSPRNGSFVQTNHKPKKKGFFARVVSAIKGE